MLVMGQAMVLDRVPPEPRAFWKDRDHPKTDPQIPKERQAFSILKLADFWLISSQKCWWYDG